MTGSCAACAFSGRRLEPSASTMTYSASAASRGSGRPGACSRPSSASRPVQTARSASSSRPSSASSGSVSRGMPGAGNMCVVVHSTTLCRGLSSAASLSSRLDLPPLPMTAVMPGSMPSASQNLIRSPRYSLLRTTIPPISTGVKR